MGKRISWRVGLLLLLPIVVGAAVLAWWPSQAGAVGTIISGIATADVAILTVAVLVLNRQLVQANKALADATKATAEATKEVAESSREEAAASRQQAEATLHSLEDLRTDRELLWAHNCCEPVAPAPMIHRVQAARRWYET